MLKGRWQRCCSIMNNHDSHTAALFPLPAVLLPACINLSAATATATASSAVQDGSGGQLPAYRGSVDAVRTIVRREGWRGLYAGLAPAMLGSSESMISCYMNTSWCNLCTASFQGWQQLYVALAAALLGPSQCSTMTLIDRNSNAGTMLVLARGGKRAVA